MADSSTLANLLRARLDAVPAPENYQSLREKLMSIKPAWTPPIVKESPENLRRGKRGDSE